MVEFSSGMQGMTLNSETDIIGGFVLGSDTEIREGDLVCEKSALVGYILEKLRCARGKSLGIPRQMRLSMRQID